MIAYLDGILSYKEPTHTIIDVHGVGYMVHISLQTYSVLPGGGDRIKLFIHHLFREDLQALYGFANADEKVIISGSDWRVGRWSEHGTGHVIGYAAG